MARTKKWARMKRCLPQEVLYEILLLLLPAKSLMRFKSVCKEWLSIISDPQFISSFFKSGHPKLLLNVPQSRRWPPSGQFMFSLDYSECCRRGLTVTPHGLVPRERVPKVQVSHSSGGLVCIEFGFVSAVCNPSTREYFLPLYPPFWCRDREQKKYINHFGFDPVENKYKILRTLQLNQGGEEKDEVIVINLGPRKERWRVLDGGYHTSYLVNNDSSTQVQYNGAGVCIKGVIYYLSMQNQNHNLIAFDVRLETFKVIPLPADAAVGLSNSFLMESDGCVALVNMIDDDHIRQGGIHEIPVYTLLKLKDDQVLWISERFGVPDDLRKLLLIQTETVVTLVGTTLKGELLYATSINKSSGKSNLYVCNLKDSSLRQIEVDGLPKKQIYPAGIKDLRVCNYVENLISLKSYGRYVRRF